MDCHPATPVAEPWRMTLEDKAAGSDSYLKRKKKKKNLDRGSEGSGIAQPSVNV